MYSRSKTLLYYDGISSRTIGVNHFYSMSTNSFGSDFLYAQKSIDAKIIFV